MHIKLAFKFYKIVNYTILITAVCYKMFCVFSMIDFTSKQYFVYGKLLKFIGQLKYRYLYDVCKAGSDIIEPNILGF